MVNNQLLENLVQLHQCTQQYENCTEKRRDEDGIKRGKECMEDFVRNYEPCKSCALPKAWQNNEAPYDGEREFKHPVPLVFFTDSLMKAGSAATREEHLVDIMVVSRDPNCNYGNIRNDVNLERLREIQRKGKRITDLCGFIISLVGEDDWDGFIDYLKRHSKTPKLYWTHLTKCNTNNNRNFALRASTSCKEYLKEEIDFLNPWLIVGLGADVAKNLLPLECLSDTPLAIKTAGKFLGVGKTLDLEEKMSPNFENTELLILPHPAGNDRHYGYWYDNPTKNQLCLKFLRRPGKPKVFWFNEWIEREKYLHRAC